MKKNEQSPTPWMFSENRNRAGIWGKGESPTDRLIAYCPSLDIDGPESRIHVDNAAFIVRAVNSHADLVAALQEIAEYVRTQRVDLDGVVITKIVQAALAKESIACRQG